MKLQEKRDSVKNKKKEREKELKKKMSNIDDLFQIKKKINGIENAKATRIKGIR